MERSVPFRDLLLADLALVLELAPARDVAFALGRFWERREEGGSILEELRVVGRLSDEEVARLEAEGASTLHPVSASGRASPG